MWLFDRNSLDQAVNVIPGVSSQFDSNGRRNESDIFVRGFGRWQVPLMLDGVRIYLPADNRLDFARFLTADIAAVQVQKGYASVLDGPGAMGGAINLVSRKPTKPFEFEVSGRLGGRSEHENWDGFSTLSLGPAHSGGWCRFLGRPGWRREERQPRARSNWGGASIRLRTSAQLSLRTSVPLTEEAANTAYRLSIAAGSENGTSVDGEGR